MTIFNINICNIMSDEDDYIITKVLDAHTTKQIIYCKSATQYT